MRTSPVITRRETLANAGTQFKHGGSVTRNLPEAKKLERMTRTILGQSIGNSTADAIVDLLRNRPEGVTRTEVSAHFGGNKSSAEMDALLPLLSRAARLVSGCAQ